MSIVLTCACGAQSAAAEEFAGQMVVCPNCGRHIQVPLPNSNSAMAGFHKPQQFRDPPGTVPPVSPANRRRLMVVGIAAIVILISSFFAVPMIMHGQGGEFVDKVSSHPIMREKIGSVNSYRWNMFASLGAGRKHHIFDIKGTKGEGKLDCREHILGNDEIVLKTSEGTWVLME